MTVRPGDDLAALAAGAPEGTRFLLGPGIHRRHDVTPRDRQQFIGRDGAVLNGAMLLLAWTREPPFWVAGDLPDPLPFHGECAAGRELCSRREDLFVGGRLYRRAASLGDLAPGLWYREGSRLWLAEDPAGKPVELGVTPRAFGGMARSVVLENLVVEKYASAAQTGAIAGDDGRDWRLAGVTARWNHGAGLSFGPGARIEGGSFSHNGQIGIVGSGEGASIEGTEIAFNNHAGYDSRWEAGGTKFWETRGLTVRNACVHHNDGPGLWTDNDNVDVLLENNLVFSNAEEGIRHEISFDAVIRGNVVARNATGGFDDWLWGSQILLQNGSNTEVRGNLVEVAAGFGNGIGVIHQNRGAGALGPWATSGNIVRGNTVVHLGGQGRSGIVTDTGESRFWEEAGNVLDGNTYIVADGSARHWTSRHRDEDWTGARRLGLERHGRLVVEQRLPLVLSCAERAPR